MPGFGTRQQRYRRNSARPMAHVSSSALAKVRRRSFRSSKNTRSAAKSPKPGTIHAAHSPAGLRDLQKRHAEWQALGEPVDLISREEMLEKTGTKVFFGGLLDHRAGTVNPMGYCRGLARAAIGAGATISTGARVTKLQRDGETWVVETTNGTVRAKHVVLGTNAYTDELWPDLKRVYTLIHFFQLATKPLQVDKSHIMPGRQGIWDTGQIMFSLRRDAFDRLVIGSMGTVVGAVGRGLSHRWARKQLARIYPELGPVEFEEAWHGKIAMTPDHLPRIYELAPNLYTPIGYNGRGITTGTIFGECMADLISGMDPSELPLPITELRTVPTATFDVPYLPDRLYGQSGAEKPMNASNQNEIRVGVDIGGTFTDVALQHPDGLSTCKVLTNYSQPEQAILDGIVKAARQAGVGLADIGQVIHGTTLVTNSLIERRGAKTAFITTEGFRDVIEMRSENRFEQYDLNLNLPKPLVPREHRFTLNERMGPGAEVLLALDVAEVSAVVDHIREGGFESVAVGLMHAYANDAHEVAMGNALRAALPELSISLSSVISPQMRELPRFNTVIANAYVQPQVADYLGRLVARLRETGVDAPVFMLHSGGGLITVETAAEQPVRLLESGPAGGAIFAADFARAQGLDKVLSFDMGGTTAKICLIEDGAPKTANTFEVARTYRFKKGSGMTVSTPVVEMVEIGAGGGSIASIDTMGRLQVGPRSAASEPGPACYGRGGEEPTVTDANLLLGRLDPDNFAGGSIRLFPDNSASAAEKLMLSTRDAAFGITELVDENMANAARVHTVENGRDIEHFTMIAFGGGAPLHACRLCEKLGIKALIVPPGAGVGSAIGFLKAPFSFEATRGLFQRMDAFDAEAVNAALTEMEAEARAFVDEGARGAKTEIRLTAQMRYSGQGWEIPVVLPHKTFASGDVDLILDAFDHAYRTLFGRTIDGLPVEVTNWLLTVSTILPDVEPVVPHRSGADAAVSRHRRFYDAALRAEVEAREVERSNMSPGQVVDGPAIIVESETSTIVTSAYCAVGQGDGSLLLLAKEA